MSNLQWFFFFFYFKVLDHLKILCKIEVLNKKIKNIEFNFSVIIRKYQTSDILNKSDLINQTSQNISRTSFIFDRTVNTHSGNCTTQREYFYPQSKQKSREPYDYTVRSVRRPVCLFNYIKT